MAKKLTEKRLRNIIAVTLAEVRSIPAEYGPSYSVLTIRFAEGSDPQALSIPYKPWENRAEITVPLRVVEVGHD
jgi:hypothetical protein